MEGIGEIYQVQKISGERVVNVVVMGFGEPLDNHKALLAERIAFGKCYMI